MDVNKNQIDDNENAKISTTINNSESINNIRRASACGAILENGSACMETKTLSILHEFNKLYRDRLEYIEKTVGDNIEVLINNKIIN